MDAADTERAPTIRRIHASATNAVNPFRLNTATLTLKSPLGKALIALSALAQKERRGRLLLKQITTMNSSLNAQAVVHVTARQVSALATPVTGVKAAVVPPALTSAPGMVSARTSSTMRMMPVPFTQLLGTL